MQRVFGALAAFGGWISLLLSAAVGLLATELLGLSHTEGPLPLSAVYGIPEVIVLWVLVGAALLALLPVGAAMVSERPSRALYTAAGAMALTGIALLPDELGRIHALVILPGAGFFALGGLLLGQSPAEAGAGADGPAREEATAPAAVSAPAGAAQPARAAAAPTAPARSRGRRASAYLCPWCMAEYKARQATCDSCGAALAAGPRVVEEAIPGLTVVDPHLRDYEHRVAHPAPKHRSSLLSMMMGDRDDRILEPAATPSLDGDAIRPPSDEVRLEMARLEMEMAAAAAAHDLALREAAAASDEASGSAAD